MSHQKPNKKLYQNLASSLAGSPTDFSSFPEISVLNLAVENGIASLLSWRISNGSVTGLSENTVQDLTNLARPRAIHDLILNNDSKNLLNLLAGCGIPALLLKGTPLSLLVYNKPYLRERCDTDVYIPQDSVAETASLLEDNGYSVHNLGQRTHASKQFQASIRSFQQSSSTFDIHYCLSNRILFQTTLPFDECWQEKQAVTALCSQAWTLSNQDLLVHACIHRIAHCRGTERNRLIWLYDIHLLWQAMTAEEKETFVQKALAKKIGALSADALQTCNELFTPVGAASAAIQPWIDELQKNKKTEPTAPLINASKRRWAWADLMAIEGLIAKLAFAKELILKK